MKLKKELISYIIFGVLTTIVNIVVYILLSSFLGIQYIISNIAAWFFSVLFAYITNRIWVFESKNKNILKEAILFFGGRLFSGLVDTVLMIIFIDILFIDDFISKIVIAIIVIILNYILSKLIVFKK